jgi:uncharacterized protein YpmB
MGKIRFIIVIILAIITMIWFVTQTLPAYEKMQEAGREVEKAKADLAKSQQELKEAQQRYNEYCATHSEC